MSIYKQLGLVMEEVGAVRKADKNTHQNFNFRGIDAVVNAVSPALRKHGVVVVPEVQDYKYETVTVGNPGKPMASVRLIVKYTFFAADGSNVVTTVAAESFDSGDKATAKAHSVAFRTCLLQTLCLPTDETDPDADSYERSSHPTAHKPVQRVAPERPKQDDNVVPIGEKKTGGQISTAQQGFVRKLMKETFLESISEVASNVCGRDINDVQDLSSGEASAVIKELIALKEALQ
jgi:hypothetical protein